MSIPDFYDSNTTLNHVLQGASKGAAKGAVIGTSIVYSALGYGIAQNILESGNRAIGNEPISLIFEGGCESRQFQDLSSFSNSYPSISLTTFIVYTIGLSTTCGLLMGAVYGVSKSIFEKKPQ